LGQKGGEVDGGGGFAHAAFAIGDRQDFGHNSVLCKSVSLQLW
jgi:hypothetical protein